NERFLRCRWRRAWCALGSGTSFARSPGAKRWRRPCGDYGLSSLCWVVVCCAVGPPPRMKARVCVRACAGSMRCRRTPASVEGSDPGDLADIIRAIRHGVTYANMHTTKYPGGEIRGQILGHSEERDEADGD